MWISAVKRSRVDPNPYYDVTNCVLMINLRQNNTWICNSEAHTSCKWSFLQQCMWQVLHLHTTTKLQIISVLPQCKPTQCHPGQVRRLNNKLESITYRCSSGWNARYLAMRQSAASDCERGKNQKPFPISRDNRITASSSSSSSANNKLVYLIVNEE